MANIVQTPSFVSDYGSQQAAINKRIAIAEAIMRGLKQNKPDDLNVVGGHVIRNNPWAGVLNNVTGAIGNYQQNQAIQETGELEDKKRQALVEAISGGNLNVESLAKSGVDPENISKFAIAQQLQRSKPATWHQVFDNAGKLWMQSDRGEVRRPTNAETGQPMDFQGALYDPQAVYERSQAENAVKPQKTVDAQDREMITTPAQANPPAYGKFGMPPSGAYQPQKQEMPEGTGDLDLIKKAMDTVVGPGTSEKASNGGIFEPTPEQESLIDAEYRRLKSLAPRPGEYQGMRGPSMQDKAQVDIEKARQISEIDLQKQEQLAEIKPQAEMKGQAIADLPDVDRKTETAIQTIDKLLKHPGFSGAVGFPSIAGALNWRGSPEVGFRELVKQAMGQEFLNALKALKGTGQITEVEGAKAQAAQGSLETAQSEEDFIRSAHDLKQELRNLRALAYKKAGMQSPYAMPVNDDKKTRIEALKAKHGLK